MSPTYNCQVNYVSFVWRGNWDKNAIESHFMPLNHRCYVIGSNIVLSDNIFYVIGLYVILSDHIFHVIGSDFMPLDRTSCHWIELHAIGSDFMLLDLTSCYWIGLYVIGSYHSFGSISFHWSTFIGSAVHHKK